jgi:hypothetical protein
MDKPNRKTDRAAENKQSEEICSQIWLMKFLDSSDKKAPFKVCEFIRYLNQVKDVRSRD